MTKLSLMLAMTFLISACSKNRQGSVPDEVSAQSANLKTDTITLSEKQLQAVGIILGEIEEKNLSDLIHTNGFLRLPPQNIAQVSVLMGGVVKTIKVKEDDFIQKGQVLATLEHPDFTRLQESYLVTKTNLGLVEAEYIRQKELYQGNVGAGKIFQQSEASYLTEKAHLASLENQLNMIGISVDELSTGKIIPTVPVRSPISGYVSQINVNIGTLAQPGTSLFEIIDNRHLRAELLVYEKDLYKVKEGQNVSLILANQGNRPVNGKIYAIGKTFVAATKSATVFVDIENKPSMGLIQGMYLNASIDGGQQNILAVPFGAVERSDGKEYIFLVIPQTREKDQSLLHFSMVEVRTGISESGYVSIVSAKELLPGTKIVVKNAFFVLAKSKEGENQDD